MKSSGKAPKKTSEKRTSTRKPSERKSLDKPKFTKSSDNKFAPSGNESAYKKPRYSDRDAADDAKSSDRKPYKSRSADRDDSDKPRKRYDDKGSRDDSKSSDRKPYKSRSTDRDDSDKPRKRYDDKGSRDDSKSLDRKPYKSRSTNRDDSDKPRKRYDDKGSRDDSKTSDWKPYNSKDAERSDSDRPRKRYDDNRSRDDSKYSDRKPYKSRDTERNDSDRPRERYDDNRSRDDSKYSDRKPYKSRDTERSDSDKPRKRYDDNRSRDDSKYSDRKPYKSRDTERNDSDRPRERYDDKRSRDDSKYSDRKPYKSRDEDRSGSDRPIERYTDKRNRDDADKKPYKSRDTERSDSDRPIEKYVDKRTQEEKDRISSKPYKRFDDDNNFSEGDKRKRARIVEEKTYQAKARERKEVEVLVKDNTYSKRPSFKKSSDGGVRLNKFIANAGVCSRREADTLIETGAITINGIIITQLGTKVMPNDEVRLGDQLLRGEQLQYLLLNKPKGYITTTDDPQERKTVMLIVEKACNERVYPVGRLDKNTTGLLLFTNDGDLAKKLTHPKHRIEKVYHVELDRVLTSTDMQKIADGMELEDGFIQVDGIAYGETKRECGIELHSGKNRIVRRIFESLGYGVEKLDRVVFAGLTKKELPRGKFRFLSADEVNILRRIQ